MKTIIKSIEEIKANIGNYIRFEGRGIIDGLKQRKSKYSSYLILGTEEDGTLLIKRYRGRGTSALAPYNQDQGFEIIPKEGFKALPEY